MRIREIGDVTVFKEKKILVIGGTGTIGSALVKRLMAEEPSVIRIFSRDEYKQYEMEIEIGKKDNIRFLLGDVRDLERLKRAMEGIDIVFHVAALKQVPACEYNPFEAVKTNVLGTQNVIDAAIYCNVKNVIFTSTDKTISPTNTYGATKLLAERLISTADYYKGDKGICFSAVRFGNVMGSRGSVIPLFKKQILEKREITITDGNMSRFMMSVDEAVELLLKAASYSRGGETFVLKMPVVKLQDLAEVVVSDVCSAYAISEREIKFRQIGLRPGEKIYEELMTEEESLYALDLRDMYVIVSPFHKERNDQYKNSTKARIKSYSSHEEEPISKEQIKRLIKNVNLCQVLP